MSSTAPSPKAPSPQAAPPQQDPGADIHELPASAQRHPRSYVRIVLLYLLPALVVIAAIAWFIIGTQFVKTENAYTKADIASVSTQVSAPVTQVLVKENRPVTEGDLLFRLDKEPFQIRLREVRASLERHSRDLETLKASYHEKQIALEVARSDAGFAEREYRRQSKLASSRVVSEARFDRARHDMDVARQRVTIVEQDIAQLLVSLGGDPDLRADAHPRVMEAQAKVARAEYDLANTDIYAPLTGIASKVPDKGDYIRAGFPAMSVVATTDIWIEANFKETQLTYVEPGQPVTIKVDAFPGWEWEGYIESIASATGGEFSILPAQNSTGNWVKVIQRVPIRIKIEPRGDEPLLRAGLSTHVSIDTGVRRGAFAPRKEARPIAADAAPQG